MTLLLCVLVGLGVVHTVQFSLLTRRVERLERETLQKSDFYVDKLHRVFARNMEHVPKKRGRLLGGKNGKKRGRPRKIKE